MKMLKNTIALPTSFALPAISCYSKVTKSTTLSIALFIASARGIPINVIKIKILFVIELSIKIITGSKVKTIINSTLKEVSFLIKSIKPFNA
jgi:hypothetical protein